MIPTLTRRMTLSRYPLLVGLVISGCGGSSAHPISVAVVSDARAATGPIAADAVGGLELKLLDLPAPAPPDVSVVTPTLARARTAYSEGEFDTCRRELGSLDLGALLASGARDQAARMLAYESACAFGAQAKTEASVAAATLARLGLEIPDVALAGDVEAAIGDAIKAAGTVPLRPVAVTGEIGAQLRVDGDPTGCTVPCSVRVRPGLHLFAVHGDGFLPSHRWIDVTTLGTVALPQEVAPPVLAGEHWRARVGHGLPPTDHVGATLLARIAGQRVAYLQSNPDHNVTGWMILDGKVVATATRDRTETSALLGDLAYDGGVLVRPPVWKRPWFWIAVSSVAVVAAGTIFAVTYEPDIVTKVVVQ